MKAQFKFADKQCAEYVAVIGESEKKSGTYTVKRLSDGSAETCPADRITEYFSGR